MPIYFQIQILISFENKPMCLLKHKFYPLSSYFRNSNLTLTLNGGRNYLSKSY